MSIMFFRRRLQSRNAANSFSIVRIDVYFLYNLHCCVLRVCRYICDDLCILAASLGYCNFGISPRQQINRKNSCVCTQKDLMLLIRRLPIFWYCHVSTAKEVKTLLINFNFSSQFFIFYIPLQITSASLRGLIPANFFLIQDYHHASALQMKDLLQ